MKPIRKSKKAAMPKKVSYRLIDRESEAGAIMYRMLFDLVHDHHSELRGARIALAWSLSWKPDVDGRVTLGKCKRASDLDRELVDLDFVIILQQEFFQDALVTNAQRRALMDHELCHATVKLDENYEPMEDERGRIVYRTRKHDIEEFSEIVERHGLYKRDLEQFARAINRSKVKQGELFDASEPAEPITVPPETLPPPTIEGEEEDVRARCTKCQAILVVDEILAKLGLCSACVTKVADAQAGASA
jgi:hypothetical protein